MLILFGLSLVGCATIVKSSRQRVEFVAPNVTAIETPDGKIEIEDGKRVAMLSRSRANVPVRVICTDGTKQDGTLETGFDWGWGFVGNIFSFQVIGWVVDGFNDKSYHYDSTIEIGSSCSKIEKTAAVKPNDEHLSTEKAN